METTQSIPTVLVLEHRSLLSGGIASRLREYENVFNVRLIDNDSVNFSETIQTESPSIIFLDAGDSDVFQKTPVTQLLERAPMQRSLGLIYPATEYVFFQALNCRLLMQWIWWV